jgi:hypothetical protein
MKWFIPPANFAMADHAYELGGARRYVIYAAKMLQGALMAVLVALPILWTIGVDELLTSPAAIVFIAWSCLVIGLVEKVQGLTDGAPGYNGAINPLDWACDLALMMAWTLLFTVPWHRWGWAMVVVAAFALTWPWSQE